jgi:glutamate--cysteine ligase
MRTPIISFLDTLLQNRGSEISQWFETQFRATPAPIYASVDLRHSGHKIVPVDTNLFPAGFNNISDAARARASIGFKRYLASHFPQARKILLLAENHTRNLGYLENLFVLQRLLVEAGAEVVIGRTEGNEVLELDTMHGNRVVEYPLQKRDGKVVTSAGFEADLVVLNNDLTAGVPAVITDISQPLVPSPALGWHQRRKSQHFKAYGKVANEFATAFDFDCWKIWTVFDHRAELDFKERQGMDSLVDATREVLIRIANKYEAYGIEETPYAYIKADAGTYGMGIMTVRDPEELRELNKKDRNKMNIVKEGAQVTEVIIQEGVPTIDKVGEASAEPMIYCVNGQAIGGAMRVNDSRDAYNNLNAAGMRFVGLCDQVEKSEASDRVVLDECNFSVYSLIAKLANLAATRE